MKKDKLYRALDVCIQSLQSGMDLDQVLDLYPKWRRELGPLIRSAYVANQIGGSTVFNQDGFEKERQKYLEAAQTIIPETQIPGKSGRLGGCMSLLILGMIVFLALSGGVFLSGRALPGSLFYGFKEASRDIRLFFIEDSRGYIQTNLLMDEERVQEIEEVIHKGRRVPVNFGGRITQGGDGEWKVHNLLIIYDAETQLVGDIWPGYYVQVEGVLLEDGSILAKRIQFQQFLIKGTVETLTPERMIVDGIEILLAPDTLLLGSIEPGSKVEVMTLLADEGLYRARLIKVIE
ncbi:MAG TPA: DUF5666 domain-containing protein [Anaerolineales bacterium]|nr:DUF5666 domain-containing protein [Anaerolineales bacterium]